MKEIFNGLCYALISGMVLCITYSCSSQSVDIHDVTMDEPADQSHFSDAFQVNRILGKGINLGNTLEAPNEGEWGLTIREEYLDEVKQAGFESVRIPIRWNAHALEGFPFTIDEAFFDRVDEVIAWAFDRDLAVMINIHHYNELMEQPHEQRDRFLKIWEQIAAHYQEYPEELVFEILNEPHDNLTPAIWNSFLADALGIIRQTNPGRVIAVGTAEWGGFGSLQDLELPDNDRQIITTVHYYNPFHFTHQGADWVGDEADQWLGTVWDGADHEKAEVDSDFDSVEQWARNHDRPIHVGEFGAFSTADDLSREQWTAYVRESSENRQFSWAYWEFGSGFGAYDPGSGEWREYLLRALIPDSPVIE